MNVIFEKLRDVNTPSRSYTSAAGWDFYIPNSWHLTEAGLKFYTEVGAMRRMPEWESTTIRPGNSLFVPSGLRVKMPTGIALRFDNRSSLAIQGLVVGATIVDNDYQGEIHINIINTSDEVRVLKCGQKVIQGIFFNTLDLNLTEHDKANSEPLFSSVSTRGGRGFGSSGR